MNEVDVSQLQQNFTSPSIKSLSATAKVCETEGIVPGKFCEEYFLKGRVATRSPSLSLFMA